MIIAIIALVAALGGTAVAAKTLVSRSSQLGANVVTSKKIKKGQVKRSDIRSNAIDGTKVADGSLSAADIAGGLPAGPRGPQGIQGPQGLPGEKGEKGDEGDKGATGPAGTADRYARVSGAGIITVGWNMLDVVSAPSPEDGIYCFTLPKTPQVAHVTNASSNFTMIPTVTVNANGNLSFCPDSAQLRVVMTDALDGVAKDAAFHLLIEEL